MDKTKLFEVAKAMVAPKKGILAADESFPTIEKRFTSIGIESTEENRKAYRDMLFTTPGIEAFISGIILFDETIRQSFVELLQSKGILSGIKVDEGTESYSVSNNNEAIVEKVTKGLEGLAPRLPAYYAMGARFAKWRAVIAIGEGIPTEACIKENAKRLAMYAKICQENGLVPMIEPEILMDGEHTIDDCENATAKTLQAVFQEIQANGVLPEGLILKTNMVLSGKECLVQADLEEVAEKTVKTLKETVPSSVAGVVFLSGGQDSVLATERLNAIEKMGPHPWPVTFSYSRALQDKALKTWVGKKENVAAAQTAFYKRAKLNSAAREGAYTPEMEKD